MLNGVMLLWFLLTAVATLFVAIDIRQTPESPVLKWGFVLVTAYTGPVGAFLFVLGCREPLPGLHERYAAARWRQVLGSTMHCVAGDGIGILAGAAMASLLSLPRLIDIPLEYVLGFGFGWTIFQAMFMRDMTGGSYGRSLATTFIPEFLSMNLLMAGMLPIAALGRTLIAAPLTPRAPDFCFLMSMALLSGFIITYPINWWLVANGLKHGMMTVQPRAVSDQLNAETAASLPTGPMQQLELGRSHSPNIAHEPRPSRVQIMGVAALSTAIFGLATWLALVLDRA